MKSAKGKSQSENDPLETAAKRPAHDPLAGAPPLTDDEFYRLSKLVARAMRTTKGHAARLVRYLSPAQQRALRSAFQETADKQD